MLTNDSALSESTFADLIIYDPKVSDSSTNNEKMESDCISTASTPEAMAITSDLNDGNLFKSSITF